MGLRRRPLQVIAVAGVTATLACCCYTANAAYGRPGQDGPPTRLHSSTPAGVDPEVRVRLSEQTTSAEISGDQGLRLGTGSGEGWVEGQSATLSASGPEVAVRLGERKWRTPDTVRVVGLRKGLLRVGDRSYRGSLEVFVTDGELVVVNRLGLEEYLYGVLPCEIGPMKAETFEAVKAQAVAARTFTRARLGRREGLGFDLFDTFARDQEYRGAGCEIGLGRRAVDETRGEVLIYRGEPIEALYHANCGGTTARGSKPYHKSVRDTPGHRPGTAFCSWSQHFRWQVAIDRDEFEERLGRLPGIASRARLKSYRLDKDGVSGRVNKLRLTTDRGDFAVPGSAFRLGLGLKSTRFDMTVKGGTVRFEGGGWGHGVGLCQNGAVEMARRGHGYRDILLHYYPEVRIGRMD